MTTLEDLSLYTAPIAEQLRPETYGFTTVLTPQGYNPKTRKGRARGYSTAILHLTPSDFSGLNVCQFASPGCRAGCLHLAGHAGIIKRGQTTNNIIQARLKRTKLFRYNRFAFGRLLIEAITTHIRRARKNGLIPVVRLNGTSDLPWERLLFEGQTILARFPEIQFYDYTKDPRRAIANARGEHPANYHLTFSRSEINDADCHEVLAAGGNVAVVFAKHLPDIWAGVRVVDADQDDLRFLDPRGVILGLKAKGRNGKRDTSGFVVRQAA